MELSKKEDIQQILNRVPLFAGLKDNWQALSVLADFMTVRDLAAHAHLIDEGALGDEYFILIEGQVSIYKKTPEGELFKVVVLKADIFPGLGEGGLIEAEPRSATVITDVPSKCLVLTRDQFANFMNSNPAWAILILKRIAIALMGRVKTLNNDISLLHRALMSEIRGE